MRVSEESTPRRTVHEWIDEDGTILSWTETTPGEVRVSTDLWLAIISTLGFEPLEEGE